MNAYFVYIVECNDKSYYTGVTNNLDKRIYEHNFGNNSQSYTFSRRPVKLVFSQCFTNVNEAINAEKQIKGWSRKKKEALMSNNFELLKELASCKNSTSSNRN